MTAGLRLIAAAFLTAAIMVVVGWGVSGIAMVGPLAGRRIAALVPQIEVSALFVIGVALGGRMLDAERRPGFWQALAVTARGPQCVIARAAGAELAIVVQLLGGGMVVWLLASVLPGGPALRDIASSRLLLTAFALFGVGLSGWASAACRGGLTALAVRLGVVVAMLAVPFAVAPVIAIAGARPELIAAAMLASPWIVAAGATGLDLLRMQWLYAFSPLGSLEASYPGLCAAVAAYGGAGLLMLALAARAVRRAATRVVS